MNDPMSEALSRKKHGITLKIEVVPENVDVNESPGDEMPEIHTEGEMEPEEEMKDKDERMNKFGLAPDSEEAKAETDEELAKSEMTDEDVRSHFAGLNGPGINENTLQGKLVKKAIK